jgi:Putative zinc-finger
MAWSDFRAGTLKLAEIAKIAQRRIQDEQLRSEFAHPDADLLAAFAEQALPARERDQVLAHLAKCADCREVSALAGAAIPEPELASAEGAGKAARGRTSKSLWSWGPLRWTAVAATAAVVLSAVWLNRKDVQQHDMTAGTEMNPAIVQPQNGPATLPPAPTSDLKSVPGVPAVPAESSAKLDVAVKSKNASPKTMERESAKTLGTDSSSVVKKRLMANSARDEEQKDMPLLRARNSGQFDLLQAGNSPSPQAEGGSMPKTVGAAKMQRAVPPAGVATANNALTAPPKSAPQAPPQITMTYSRQSAAELAPAADMAESQAEATSAPGAAGNAKSAVRVGPMATPLPTDQSSLESLQKSAALQSSGTLWRVSSSGELQHSTDSGHTWRTALGEHPSKFRSVASSGATVWAGGDDGALWSSFNNGLTWRKLTPIIDGHSPRGNVENIQLAAPGKVTFTTSAGETWTTSDFGRNWSLQSE